MTEKEESSLYRKFQETKQEKIRLQCAIDGFFDEEGTPGKEKEQYGNYLKRRIRPASEQLLLQEKCGQLRILCELGWMNASMLDSLIRIASQNGRPVLVLELLILKQEMFGFEENG